MDYNKLVSDLLSGCEENCANCEYEGDSEFECTIAKLAATAITDLLARAEEAEARAEKAERERDDLLKEIAGGCGMCFHYEDCMKNHYSCCDGAEWEWRGTKEE